MLDELFLWFILIGFLAQLVDGALGMAYGVISSTFLIALGLPPALASANVHTAEIVTTAISGASHALLRNVDWGVFWRLSLFGSLGGLFGAFLISRIHVDFARPMIAVYLLFMGLIVITKAFGRVPNEPKLGRVRLLGLFGGFADAAGGGGWGPVVASNLIARGGAPARMIGTVNLSEFVVTLAISLSFLITLGPTFGEAALGLLVGGAVASPIAAWATTRVPRKPFMLLVGSAICLLSAYNLIRYAGAI